METNAPLPRTVCATSWILGLLSLALYAATASPAIGFGDSGELVTVAVTGGVAHPPGYPLYALLGKLFTLLPVGTIPYRVNLLSAVCGAAAVGVTHRLAWRMLNNASGAMAAAALLTVSATFWQYAVYAKNYTLNALLLLCTLNLIVRLRAHPNHRRFAAVVGVVGLSLANHYQSVLLSLPACIWLLIGHRRDMPLTLHDVLPPRLRRHPVLGSVGWIAILLLPGLLLYLYLPVRAAAAPFINWDDPTTLERFLRAVTMRDFSTLHGIGSTSAWVSRLRDGYLPLFLQQFTPAVLLLAVLGVVHLARPRSRHFLEATGLLWASFVLGVTLNYNAPVDRYMTVALAGFFIPAHLVVALWIGAGVADLHERLSRAWRSGSSNGAADRAAAPWVSNLASGTLVIILTLFVLHANLPANNHAQDYAAEDYGWNVLHTLPPNAVLITQGHHTTFPLWYWQAVHGVRTDVTVVFSDLLVWPWYRAQLRQRGTLDLPEADGYGDMTAAGLTVILANMNGRAVFVDYFAALALSGALAPHASLQWGGLVARVTAGAGGNAIDAVATLQWIGSYHAHDLTRVPRDAVIENCLIPEAFMHDQLGAWYEASGNSERAIAQWTLATAIVPTDLNAHLGLARAWLHAGDRDRARAELLRALPEADATTRAAIVTQLHALEP